MVIFPGINFQTAWGTGNTYCQIHQWVDKRGARVPVAYEEGKRASVQGPEPAPTSALRPICSAMSIILLPPSVSSLLHLPALSSLFHLSSIEIATRAADNFTRIYYSAYDSSTRLG
ncbi:hypothetical protein B0H14DRAFT_3462525 [Mycena olivaceomarginata]|nr:hypothetical protein B0H14DRAFT_3462525 [Mycena olivaceomarginata]